MSGPGLFPLFGGAPTFAWMTVTVTKHATKPFYPFGDRKRTKRGMRRLRAKFGPDLMRRAPCAIVMRAEQRMFVHPVIWEGIQKQMLDASPPPRGWI